MAKGFRRQRPAPSTGLFTRGELKGLERELKRYSTDDELIRRAAAQPAEYDDQVMDRLIYEMNPRVHIEHPFAQGVLKNCIVHSGLYAAYLRILERREKV